MRLSKPLLALILAAAFGGCSEEQTPEEAKNVQIRQDIETTISEIEAKTRTKARGLGMGNAETVSIEEARAFVCNKLIGQLREAKEREGREGVATDLTTYACRERAEWLEVMRGTAKDQGMNGSDTANLNESRDFVCDRIKESVRAVKKESDKQTLQTEGRVFDCIF